MLSERALRIRVFRRRLGLLSAAVCFLLAAGPRAQAAPAAAAFRDVDGLSPQALAAALDAMSCARSRGVSGRSDLLTLIDYSLPSTQPRFWVLDLENGRVLFHELVAHGIGSGENYAVRFSNIDGSRQTSLGLFLTGSTYEGSNGYSLRLRGLDPGLNDRAGDRAIVMHGAWYVSTDQIRRHGRLGRSWGCPALAKSIAPRVIDRIKEGSFLFAWSDRATGSRRQSCAAPDSATVAGR